MKKESEMKKEYEVPELKVVLLESDECVLNETSGGDDDPIWD